MLWMFPPPSQTREFYLFITVSVRKMKIGSPNRDPESLAVLVWALLSISGQSAGTQESGDLFLCSPYTVKLGLVGLL